MGLEIEARSDFSAVVSTLGTPYSCTAADKFSDCKYGGRIIVLHCLLCIQWNGNYRNWTGDHGLDLEAPWQRKQTMR